MLATPTKGEETLGLREKLSLAFHDAEFGSLAVFTVLMFFFSFFMFLPVFSVSISAFNWSFDLGNPLGFLEHFLYCFENTTYRISIFNALFAGLCTTLISSLIGITMTIIFSRYRFRGKKFFQVLTIMPLVAPPFVGAFAVSRLLRGNGIISNFFQIFIPGLPDLLGRSIWGIIFIQSIHLWPLIYFNTAASYSKIDPVQEEQARNLGSWSLNLYRTIILPLVTPGFMAGAVLVFIFSISDLGTPIVMNFSQYAPFLAFSKLREQREQYIESAYAIVIIILIISVLALIFASKVVGMRDYASDKVSGMEQTRLMKRPTRKKAVLIYSLIFSVLLISLLPHIGVIVVAFVQRIQIGEVIPTLWSIDGLITTLQRGEVLSMIFNSTVYAGLAMGLTILIGVVVAFLLIRKKNIKGVSLVMAIIGGYIGLVLGAQVATSLSTVVEKNVAMFGAMAIGAFLFFVIGKLMNLQCLEFFSTMPFAIPGIVLAFGYLTFFSDPSSLWGILPAELDAIPIVGFFTASIRNSVLSIPNNPMEFRFTNIWLIFVVSYTMRRMPYTVQASTAVLRQIHHSLEEVAHNLGATTRQSLTRITIPLMASGIFAGGILTFVTSFTEVSTSIVITPQHEFWNPLKIINPQINIPESATPLTKGIYDEVTRGGDMTAGVLGLIQLLAAAIGMTITQRLLGEKTGTAFGGG